SEVPSAVDHTPGPGRCAATDSESPSDATGLPTGSSEMADGEADDALLWAAYDARPARGRRSAVVAASLALAVAATTALAMLLLGRGSTSSHASESQRSVPSQAVG